MIVYKITNKINSKVYVGKTSKSIQERLKKHIKCAENKVNRHLYDAMNHYGYDNFLIEIIEEVNTEEELNEREIFWITELNSTSPNGYNMTSGGDGGYTLGKWTDEQRKSLYENQAKKRTGVKRTEEQRKNFSKAAKSREANKTEEQKAEIARKISETNKRLGLEPPEETRWKKGQIGTFTGKTHTKEARDKLSRARKGKTYEDVFGEERAVLEKEKRKKSFSGENNPKYVEFTKENKLNLLNILMSNPNTPFKEIVILSNTKSKGSKISGFLKECGIKNLQRFRYLSSEEQKLILQEAIEYVIKNY